MIFSLMKSSGSKSFVKLVHVQKVLASRRVLHAPRVYIFFIAESEGALFIAEKTSQW